jgi:hypothetical protein
MVPQVTAEDNLCLKASQLTLFYRLLPYLGRIRAMLDPFGQAKTHALALSFGGRKYS